MIIFKAYFQRIAELLMIVAVTSITLTAQAEPLREKQNYVKFDLGSEHTFRAPLKLLKSKNGLFWYFFKDHLLVQNGPQRQKLSFAHLIKRNIASAVRINAVQLPQGIVFSVQKSLFYIPFDTLEIEAVSLKLDPKDYIMGLTTSDNGTLWVVTLKEIFWSTNLQTPFKPVSLPTNVPKSKRGNLGALKAIAIAPNKILVSTALSVIIEIEQGSTNQFNVRLLPFKKYHQERDFIFQMVLVDNRLFIGSHYGLYWFDMNDNSQHRLAVSGGITSIGSLSVDKNNVWFAANGILFKTDTDFKNLQRVSLHSNLPFDLDTVFANTIYTDDERTTWFSLDGKGLYRYNLRNNKFNLFNNNTPLKRLIDLSTHGALLIAADKAYLTETDTFIDEKVLAFELVTHDDYWYGAYDRLVHVKNEKIYSDTSTEQREVSSIVAQGNDAWYTRRIGGLFFYEGATNTHKLIENTSIRQFIIAKDGHGALISINAQHIEIIDTDNTQAPTVLHTFDHPPIDVRRDGQLITLFLDNGDVIQFNLLNRHYQRLKFADKTTVCIAHQPYTTLWWLAQEDGTLLKVDGQTGTTTTYSTVDGLPPGGVNGKFCGQFKGDVVFSTEQGLFKTTDKLTYTNDLKPKTRLFYGLKGQPPTILASRTPVQIQHDDFPLNFKMTNSSYQNIGQNRIDYKVLGLNNSWQHFASGADQTELPYLHKGNYTFIARVSNNDNVYSDEKTLSFDVLPPLWLTWWAKLIYANLIVLLSVSFFMVRTKAIRDKALKLEIIVASKTEQIRQEKQTIEKLLSLKEQEFIHVSHELRTPLTLITGPIKSAYAKTNDIAIKKDLDMATRNGERLHRMVDQLLQLERFKFRTVLAKSPQNIVYILTTITESFKVYALQKQIDITLITPTQYNMLFVSDAFEKILVNLLSNAIKYTADNGTVEIKASVDENSGFTLCITDTGIGIKPDDLTHIFDKFYRVTDQNSEKETGAGVGLALVKELVATHEGKIDLQSTYGTGTEITITFPPELALKVDDSSVNDGTSVNEELISHEISSMGIGKMAMEQPLQSDNTDKPLSLLVIEDNPDMRQYILGMMSSRFTCFTAANGQLGIDKAMQVIPDLIICDVMMPVMDGFEATKKLKENEITSHIPVILLTARGDKDSRLTGWKSLADDYIAKPFDEEELQLRATNLIALRQILRQRFTGKVLQGETLSSQEEAALNEKDAAFIDKVTTLINDNLADEQFSTEQLSDSVFMSERQLQRKLKALIDFTPREFLAHLRLIKAEELLNNGGRVSEVSDATGFSSSSYFARCFKAKHNMTPKQFSQKKE